MAVSLPKPDAFSGWTPGDEARGGARLAAALYVLCGAWVCLVGPVLPGRPDLNRLGLAVVGAVAVAGGVLIWHLPWDRWGPRASLAVFPPALMLVVAHNHFSGTDGYRYAIFFMVAFAWLGLAHPPWTSVKLVPLAAIAYVAPLLEPAHRDPVALASVVYVLPSFLIVGETVAWVSERLRATQTKLAEREATFRMLFDDNPQPMWVYDAETLAFLQVNEAAVRHYGYPQSWFLSRTIVDIRPREDAAALQAELALNRRARQRTNWRHVLADGRVIDVEVTSHELRFAGRDAVLVAVQDVTDRNRIEDQLRHRAFHDPLTELANRSLFRERIAHALMGPGGTRSGVAVLFVDLDNFKAVNDSVGHAVGDRLLAAVAQRLAGALRDSDTIARLGGDEFGVLLEGADDDRATEVAMRIRSALSNPFRVGSREVIVRASVGVALAEPSSQADDLLRDADVAMYAAKHDGRDRHRVFESYMRDALLRRVDLEAELTRAIDGEEFVLQYQPIVSLAPARAGEMVGMEALARWAHPGRGLLLPDEFIPLAEDTGLVVPLGAWALREAAGQVAWWMAHEAADLAPLFVTVNVSASQLLHQDFVDHVAVAIESADVAPASIVVEITETAILQDLDDAGARLQALRGLGVRVALDDFGTGYSSLSHLASLPIDILKIDRTFVDRVDKGPEESALVRGVLKIADTMGIETVAEGVERPSQVSELELHGCTMAQGFYFGSPSPPTGIAGLLLTAGGRAVPAPPAELPKD